MQVEGIGEWAFVNNFFFSFLIIKINQSTFIIFLILFCIEITQVAIIMATTVY